MLDHYVKDTPGSVLVESTFIMLYPPDTVVVWCPFLWDPLEVGTFLHGSKIRFKIIKLYIYYKILPFIVETFL